MIKCGVLCYVGTNVLTEYNLCNLCAKNIRHVNSGPSKYSVKLPNKKYTACNSGEKCIVHVAARTSLVLSLLNAVPIRELAETCRILITRQYV